MKFVPVNIANGSTGKITARQLDKKDWARNQKAETSSFDGQLLPGGPSWLSCKITVRKMGAGPLYAPPLRSTSCATLDAARSSKGSSRNLLTRRGSLKPGQPLVDLCQRSFQLSLWG